MIYTAQLTSTYNWGIFLTFSNSLNMTLLAKDSLTAFVLFLYVCVFSTNQARGSGIDHLLDMQQTNHTNQMVA